MTNQLIPLASQIFVFLAIHSYKRKLGGVSHLVSFGTV